MPGSSQQQQPFQGAKCESTTRLYNDISTSFRRPGRLYLDYNKGLCTWKSCRFAHTCASCFKPGHGAARCRSSKSLGQGEKVDLKSNQAPRVFRHGSQIRSQLSAASPTNRPQPKVMITLVIIKLKLWPAAGCKAMVASELSSCPLLAALEVNRRSQVSLLSRAPTPVKISVLLK